MKFRNYKICCRNPKCGYETTKRYSVEEFERLQYPTGISCFLCGYPKAVVIHTNRMARDGFKPGFQRNIMKHCATYAEYKAWLKRMGLVELGYEEIPDFKPDERLNIWDREMIKLLESKGLKLSDREIKALQEGKLLDDVSENLTDNDTIEEDTRYQEGIREHEESTYREVTRGS